MQVGDKRTIPGRVITANDVYIFAGLSGDHNPIHLSEEFARTTQFGTRIAHGMLVASLISAALAACWPGCVYLGQTLGFRRPVLLGDEVTVEMDVMTIRADKPIATIATVCRNQRGEVVLDGEATVKVPVSEMGSVLSPMAAVAQAMGNESGDSQNGRPE